MACFRFQQRSRKLFFDGLAVVNRFFDLGQWLVEVGRDGELSLGQAAGALACGGMRRDDEGHDR